MLETLAMTGITSKLQVGHKLHLNCYHTSSFTLFTAASLRIEGKMNGRDAQLLCQRLGSKELTDGIVSLDVSSRIGAGTLAYRILIYHLNIIHAIVLGIAAEHRIEDSTYEA